MPLPKRRHSHSRKNKRRAHDALTPAGYIPCPQCHETKLPHRACPSCGYYKGRPVIKVKSEG